MSVTVLRSARVETGEGVALMLVAHRADGTIDLAMGSTLKAAAEELSKKLKGETVVCEPALAFVGAPLGWKSTTPAFELLCVNAGFALSFTYELPPTMVDELARLVALWVAFFQKQIWNDLTSDMALEVVRTVGGKSAAHAITVLGSGGEEFGIGFFETPKMFEAAFEGRRNAVSGFSVIADERPELAAVFELLNAAPLMVVEVVKGKPRLPKMPRWLFARALLELVIRTHLEPSAQAVVAIAEGDTVSLAKRPAAPRSKEPAPTPGQKAFALPSIMKLFELQGDEPECVLGRFAPNGTIEVAEGLDTTEAVKRLAHHTGAHRAEAALLPFGPEGEWTAFDANEHELVMRASVALGVFNHLASSSLSSLITLTMEWVEFFGTERWQTAPPRLELELERAGKKSNPVLVVLGPEEAEDDTFGMMLYGSAAEERASNNDETKTAGLMLSGENVALDLAFNPLGAPGLEVTRWKKGELDGGDEADHELASALLALVNGNSVGAIPLSDGFVRVAGAAPKAPKSKRSRRPLR